MEATVVRRGMQSKQSQWCKWLRQLWQSSMVQSSRNGTQVIFAYLFPLMKYPGVKYVILCPHLYVSFSILKTRATIMIFSHLCQ